VSDIAAERRGIVFPRGAWEQGKGETFIVPAVQYDLASIRPAGQPSGAAQPGPIALIGIFGLVRAT
jgi:hypothetical protein